MFFGLFLIPFQTHLTIRKCRQKFGKELFRILIISEGKIQA